jgi:hypothetical protein
MDRRIVDLEQFDTEFNKFFGLWSVKTLMEEIRLFIQNSPEYTEAPPSVKADKHPNYNSFKSAYWTYMEMILKRRATFNKTEGAALNKIIDSLLILTDNNHDNALVVWHEILTTMPHLKNDYLLGQTVRLTSFNYYLTEIILKVNAYNDRIKQQSNSGNDTAKPNARHSKYAKPQL